MKEAAFKALVIRQLRSEGAWCLKLHGSRFSAAGAPDLLVVHRAWTGLLELKVGKNAVSPAQRLRMAEIVRCGGRALVLRLGRDGRASIEEPFGLEVGAWERPGALVAGLVAASEAG